MAARRKKKTPVKSRKRKLMERAGIAVLKGSGSAAMGASVAVVEETVSERAGAGVRAGLAVAGLATEIFVDPQANPIIAEAGKAGLHTASGVTGYKVTKKATKEWKEREAERKHQAMLERLKEDMAPEEEETPTTKAAVEHQIPKAVAKKKTTAKPKP
jgi:TPP-dependent pyruvate/acetoin dehydrogenase alpha subunit